MIGIGGYNSSNTTNPIVKQVCCSIFTDIINVEV